MHLCCSLWLPSEQHKSCQDLLVSTGVCVCVCSRKNAGEEAWALSLTAFHTGLVLTMRNSSPRASTTVPPPWVWYNLCWFGSNNPYLVKFSTGQLRHGNSQLLIQIYLTSGARKALCKVKKVDMQQFWFISTGLWVDTLGQFHVNKYMFIFSLCKEKTNCTVNRNSSCWHIHLSSR